MKSLTTCTFASAGVLLAFSSLFGQNVIRAISLGDPIPAYQPDPNLIRVDNTSSNGALVTLGFQPCPEPVQGCGCKECLVNFTCPATCGTAAPACAVAAKAAPCAACDIVKNFHRASSAANCSCPTPVAYKPCPAPSAAGSACAPCSASCAHVRKIEYPRPILAAVKNFVSGIGHSTAPAKAEICTACVAIRNAPATIAVPTQPLPTQPPDMLPQAVSYQNPMQSTTPVPAALAPYTPQTPYFPILLPPAEDYATPR